MIDTDEFFDELWNLVQEKGRQVLCLSWDGEAPGMSGGHWIIKFHGLYFFTSSDLDPEGPYHTLDEALGEEFCVETANPELTSKYLKLEKLKEIGVDLVADGGTIYINGEGFVRRGNVLVPVGRA